MFKQLAGKWICKAQDIRRRLYQAGLFDQLDVGVPVVSIGNLTMGGTGKTPIVDWFLFEAKARHLRTGLVSRNYKAQINKTSKVDTTIAEAAILYGDEPVLLADLHPETAVYVGPQKWKSAAILTDESKIDLLVVDDGFQHLQLKRDFEVVLVDATKGLKELSPYPTGHARESRQALENADVILLTKANKATTEEIELIRGAMPFGIPVYEVSFKSRLALSEGFIPVALVSAVADNPSVLADLRKMQNIQVLSHYFFDDHHVYTESDIKKIVEDIRRLQIRKVVCTAKDYVKLKTFSEIKDLLHVMHVDLDFSQEPVKIYEFFNHLHK